MTLVDNHKVLIEFEIFLLSWKLENVARDNRHKIFHLTRTIMSRVLYYLFATSVLQYDEGIVLNILYCSNIIDEVRMKQ